MIRILRGPCFLGKSPGNRDLLMISLCRLILIGDLL